MTRRSRTTVVLSIRLPLPPGATTLGLMEFIKDAVALEVHRLQGNAKDAPLAGLQIAEMQIRVTNRETVYV